ncbi:MAG: hypothetical protein H7223_07335 [Pedobacter sp.]|nr:hypothetical protein [Pedobacter sp.]
MKKFFIKEGNQYRINPQSVNEELDTFNSEYQFKNKELLEINDDLNNYFRSNINGQLFINNELLLMKLT